MSKWEAMRLFNIDLQKFGLILENVFPFLIINSQVGLSADQLADHPALCYFDFRPKDASVRLDATDFPSETLKLLTSEFSMIRGKQSLPATPLNPDEVFFFCHEMIMVVRRQMLAYLSPTLFCLKAVNLAATPNYAIPDIFDKELFRTIGRQLSLFESDRFCDMFLETSMLVRFLDHSFQCLNQKYRLNEAIPDKRQPLSLFLKAMVNIFEAMPTVKLKSKTFFRFESRMVYSSIAFTKDEDRRFRGLVESRRTVSHAFQELFDFYFTRESDIKASQFLLPSRLSQTSGSPLDMSVRSLKSQLSRQSATPPPPDKTVGGDYFRAFREDKLHNLNEKEDFEIESDFDSATDIF